MYTFDCDTVWRVRKGDIQASAAALDAAEPLTFPSKFSTPLKEMNTSTVEKITTTLATELARKRRGKDANSAAHA